LRKRKVFAGEGAQLGRRRSYRKESRCHRSGAQGYLAHKKQCPTSDPRHNFSVGSQGGAISCQRGTALGLRGWPKCEADGRGDTGESNQSSKRGLIVFFVAVICTTIHRVPASASTNQDLQEASRSLSEGWWAGGALPSLRAYGLGTSVLPVVRLHPTLHWRACKSNTFIFINIYI
jgi:hypothetical protein